MLAAAALAAAGDAVCRWGLGMGTPPLSVAHPSIEYLMKPDQDLRRFGNRVRINALGMRSEPFPAGKDVDEYRVLVYGDSIAYGGAQIDQADLAATLMEPDLAAQLGRPVRVGNVSATSWGPGNWLAYAREYGFLDADALVLVLSSHDAYDVPTFGPLDPREHPTRQPLSALTEVLGVYLLSSLRRHIAPSSAEHLVADPEHMRKQAARALADLASFLQLAAQAVPRVVVVQHLSREELARGTLDAGAAWIEAVCQRSGVPLVSMRPYLNESVQGGADPFLDELHPSAAGQAALARAITRALLSSSDPPASVAVAGSAGAMRAP